jgi:AraC-like DNA-binding protein
MTDNEKAIIRALAGDLNDQQIDNLQENFELYLIENISLFVPIYRHCDYATTPNHCHPSFSFIYNIQQKGYILVNGVKQPNPYYGGASICAFSPGVHHQEVLSDGDFSNYIAIMIDSRFFVNELQQYTGNPNIILEARYYPPNDNLLFLLKLLMIEHNKYKSTSRTVIETLNTLITNMLVRIVLGDNNSDFTANTKDIVDLAIAFMHKHIDEKISVHDIASHSGLSASHFSKVFKDLTNKTPVEYLTRIRIEKSKRMLKISDKNLTEIAYACGFSSLSYFSRSFADQTTLTPGEYRKIFLSTNK